MVETQQDFYIGAMQTLKDGLIGGTHTVGGVHTSVLDSLAAVGLKSTLNRKITEHVYQLILGVGHLTGGLLEHALRWVPLPGGERPPTRGQRLAVSSINGAFGDWLAQNHRVWAQPMQLCRAGRTLPVDRDAIIASTGTPRPHVVIFAHGLCLNDLHWHPVDGPGFGDRWEHHQQATTFYLRYNTGLHIHENGRQFARLLHALYQHYPIPIERLSLIGHSMGGLISRSACQYAQHDEMPWLSVLQDLACLGSPHEGAGLERLGQWVTQSLAKTRITASLGRAGQQRSAGIKDLRYGCLWHADWEGSHPDAPQPARVTPLPLLPEVRYCLLAANWKTNGAETLGDGLVKVSSAMAHSLGGHPLETPQVHRPLLQGLHHMHLPTHGQVYNVLSEWLFNGLPST